MATTKESGSVPVFDTRGYVRTLVLGGGVEEKQADAHADALQGVLSGVSTKADIDGVRAELRAVRTELKADIKEVRTELKADIRELRAEMKVLGRQVELLEQKMGVQFQATQSQFRAMQSQFQVMQNQSQTMRQMMILGFSLIGTLVVVSTLLSTFS